MSFTKFGRFSAFLERLSLFCRGASFGALQLQPPAGAEAPSCGRPVVRGVRSFPLLLGESPLIFCVVFSLSLSLYIKFVVLDIIHFRSEVSVWLSL